MASSIVVRIKDAFWSRITLGILTGGIALTCPESLPSWLLLTLCCPEWVSSLAKSTLYQRIVLSVYTLCVTLGLDLGFMCLWWCCAALRNTRVSPSGISFAGKSLKLDNNDDAKDVIEAIDNCSDLQYLNLEGNTLGVDASKGIAKALENHPEFKRALWKDLFTGRMKTEIPKALEYLGNGLVTAGARLTELDLSDNAFGPIGVQGLAELLKSSSCYALEELRLNNNGLGITGGKLLASALTDCYNCSKSKGKPLALKVFIAGRNRLENDGAKALAQVFKMVGTLEEISMPQNGIYHPGISALSDAFTHNKNLQVLNLNDNTIGPKGAEAIASAMPNLQNLREINFGDCLLKTKGALLLAESLKNFHQNLEELTLGFNEIKKNGGIGIVEAMANKSKLKQLILDGNQFGEQGQEEIKKKLKEIGKLHTLGSLEENESEDSEEDTDDENVDDESEEHSEIEHSEKENDVIEVPPSIPTTITVEEFLKTPSSNNFLALGNDRIDLIFRYVKEHQDIADYMKVLMKVSTLSNDTKPEVADSSLKCSEFLYKDLFTMAQKNDQTSLVNNSILVNLGLIKNEDKKEKIAWDLDGCLHALKYIASKNYVPQSTKDTLKVFMKREIDNNKDQLGIKKQIWSTLS
ncbi:unnamed protein product [Phaedon cochleariae]|uniref:Ran-GTPase activating protein 1 C-terminal domain-containing protein n=1 Tax=Phaedon cochleariae TaxID=80249 RepID=A0A9P0GQ00_PHACE|nr:unnamed protein product [Phaedon cochleariae]